MWWKNMKYSKFRTLFFPLVIIILTIGFAPTSNCQDESISTGLSSSGIRGKIYIDGNWTETKTAGICSGDGTPTSPYVIENYEIDGKEDGNCITILNTYKYFVIENCTLYNATEDADFAGIYVENASNGIITENLLHSSKYGIFIRDASNINITFNKVGNIRGLKYLTNCTNMWLYLNTFTSSLYGVYFDDVDTINFNTPSQFLYTYQSQNYTNYLGNYYSGRVDELIDDNNDGISDIPLTGTGGTVNTTTVTSDRYALMKQYTFYFLIEPYIPEERKIPGYSLLTFVVVIGLTALILAKRLRK